MSFKKIYIFIGQKGSGKSYAGNLIQDLFGIKFVRVEDIAKEVKRDRQFDDESYHQEVFSRIESHLRNILRIESEIVFESLGLGLHFNIMIENLKMDFRVIIIRLNADPGLCLRRIKSRDHSIHINVSDDDVNKINLLFRQTNPKCDYEIDNDGSLEELIASLKRIFSP